MDDEEREQPDAEREQPDEQEILEEREERLDPENRPDNAEVDNTQRTFDPATGMFEDVDGHDAAEPAFEDEELISQEEAPGEAESGSDEGGPDPEK
jgi:hypothetical protein